MTHFKWDINQCADNPQRWYIILEKARLPRIKNIEETLVAQKYQILAKTPYLRVFRSEDFRLTWHVKGFIQVDVYNTELNESQQIEQLIKGVLNDLEGRS
ncbi:MAG: hypothetical protein EAX86_13040 [Candidatus Heimdallarchaeota archaeon]|nr:hypothetical protein [Candidatus Heimdallarchaeota archaeon]